MNQINYAICVIGYNRPKSIKRILESVERSHYNQEVSLIISIDKSENGDVIDVAESFKWTHGEKLVKTYEKNLGLRKHVLLCGDLLKKFDALVVLEDDLTVSPYYFEYVTACVEKYKDDERIAGISLYNFPLNYQCDLPFTPVQSGYDVYFMNCAMSWGQVWLKKQWKSFIEWYDVNNEEFYLDDLPKIINNWPKSSWLKYHTRYCIENDKYFVYPYVSLSTNNNDIGTHVKNKKTNFYQSEISVVSKDFVLPTFEECIIKYDGFFEPKFLAEIIGVDKAKLCVNFFNQKLIKKNIGYVLSTSKMPYKVVNSFALTYKPWEVNIIMNNIGKDLYLYDTSEPAKVQHCISGKTLHEYLYCNAIEKIYMYGLRNLSCTMLRKVLRHIKW